MGTHVLHVADHDVAGPVLVTVRPTSVSVHLVRPAGSFRNSWPTSVARVERLGHRVRLLTGAPLPIMVEVTEEARAELGLGPGSEVWVAVKATEIGVEEEGGGGGRVQ